MSEQFIATAVTLQIAQTEALGRVIGTLFIALITIVLIYISYKFGCSARQLVESPEYERLDQIMSDKVCNRGAASITAAIASLLAILIMLVTFNIYAFAGIFYPEVWIAAKTLKLF